MRVQVKTVARNKFGVYPHTEGLGEYGYTPRSRRHDLPCFFFQQSISLLIFYLYPVQYRCLPQHFGAMGINFLLYVRRRKSNPSGKIRNLNQLARLTYNSKLSILFRIQQMPTSCDFLGNLNSTSMSNLELLYSIWEQLFHSPLNLNAKFPT